MKHFTKKICLSVSVALILLLIAVFCAVAVREADRDTLAPDPDSGQLPAYSEKNLSPDESFSSCMETLFRQEASASLLNLHYTLQQPESYGITGYNTTLGQYSSRDPAAAAAAAENISHLLRQFDPEKLSVPNRLTLDVLEDSLQQNMDGASFFCYEEPLRPSTGIQAELPILLAEYTFRDTRDVSDYLQLLASIPDYFASIADYEQEKSAAGLFMSDFAADTVIRQCSDFAASGEDNYLIYTFEQKLSALDGLSVNERTDFLRQNQNLILGRVLPAFQSLSDSLRDLAGTGVNPAGLCAYENGKSYYEYLVRLSTGSSATVEELKSRVENQRIADLASAALLLKRDPSLQDTAEAVSAPCQTPEEMISLLKTAILTDFPTPPDCASTVKYVDPAMEDYLAPAFYLTSPMDHLEENSIYINQKNGYEGIRLFTTLAHEGYPGHLYQNVCFYTSHPAPIRALLGYPGYAEGWATYVEMNAYRYAGISDEAASLLALNQSAILSLYATADIGIHHEGWSYSDTYRFFSDFGVTDEAAVRDIFELIVEEPAHYLKYYIGYLEFLSLKDFAQEQLGDAYSEKAFHRAVLEIGPAPFDIIKKYLPYYL